MKGNDSQVIESLLMAAGIFTYICLLFSMFVGMLMLIVTENPLLQILSFWIGGMLVLNGFFIAHIWRASK